MIKDNIQRAKEADTTGFFKKVRKSYSSKMEFVKVDKEVTDTKGLYKRVKYFFMIDGFVYAPLN